MKVMMMVMMMMTMFRKKVLMIIAMDCAIRAVHKLIYIVSKNIKYLKTS